MQQNHHSSSEHNDKCADSNTDFGLEQKETCVDLNKKRVKIDVEDCMSLDPGASSFRSLRSSLRNANLQAKANMRKAAQEERELLLGGGEESTARRRNLQFISLGVGYQCITTLIALKFTETNRSY